MRTMLILTMAILTSCSTAGADDGPRTVAGDGSSDADGDGEPIGVTMQVWSASCEGGGLVQDEVPSQDGILVTELCGPSLEDGDQCTQAGNLHRAEGATTFEANCGTAGYGDDAADYTLHVKYIGPAE